MRRVRGHAHHADPEPIGGLEVDVVESGATQGDQTYALLFQPFENRGIQFIVDEDAHHLAPGGKAAVWSVNRGSSQSMSAPKRPANGSKAWWTNAGN